MTTDELRLRLRHLIDTYVSDQIAKADLDSLVAMHDVPAKAILAELETARSRAMAEADRKLVKEIAFYFC
ncbi:hypothetical protein JQ633_19905 [Bradyrhizobium tropiciagri]|uniref:hypothetical protein n=1 Tax=Bradyrhizobium tropiciagri TaxID=312253 RepID=UPI001BA76863|nr:hypothetical protein [Bradyrhizobium tropiciagri]MBR0872637.1 hypothetical protein [Bradyrhizobium tropiciagri]